MLLYTLLMVWNLLPKEFSVRHPWHRSIWLKESNRLQRIIFDFVYWSMISVWVFQNKHKLEQLSKNQFHTEMITKKNMINQRNKDRKNDRQKRMTKKFRWVTWNKCVSKENYMSVKILNIYSFNNLSAKSRKIECKNRNS